MEFAAIALEAVAAGGAEAAGAAAIGSEAAIGAGAAAAGAGEAALATGATIAADGTAAAGAAGAAAGGGSLFSSIGGASTVGSILQGGATIASVLGTQQAGAAQAQNYELQAIDAETNQGVETVQGLERRQSIRAKLLNTIGARDLATAAGGTDLTFGTPVAAREQSVRDTATALNADEETEQFNRQRLAERAANLRAMAAEAKRAADTKSAGTLLSGAASMFRRG